MKTAIAVALATTLLSTSRVCADDKADLKKIQGEWSVKSVKRGGKKPPANTKLLKLLVKDIVLTLVLENDGKQQKIPTNFKLDPSKSPKQIDFFRTAGKVDSHGIYKIEGKTLTLCFVSSEKERPKKFESVVGSRVNLIVFERPAKNK